MSDLLNIIAPVFLVIGFGYWAAWKGYFNHEATDGLMIFAQKFALPILLFRAISRLNLQQSFDLRLLASFYSGATLGFVVGIMGARLIFHRPWEDSVAIGFIGLFSNSLLLGLPITERAYGPDALAANYAIIALHSPFCYSLGITTMEIVRAKDGGKLSKLVYDVLKAIFSNALILGILAGFVVNLAGISVPQFIMDAGNLIARAALPAALFGLGGVLWRYRPEGDLRTILFIVAVSLLLHPIVTWGLGQALGLSQSAFRSAVLTAAMAPGINAYIFANMYGVARRVAASAVLIGTILAIFTTWMWLALLP